MDKEQILYTKEFDEELKEIPFLKMHESYLPFIGKDYLKQGKKILIVGESHYVSNDWNWDKQVFDVWWDEDWKDKLLSNNLIPNETFTDWFNTRLHVNRAIVGEERAIKQVIQNPLSILAEKVFRQDCEGSLSNIAFMNFFQFPSLENGIGIWKSILNKAIDVSTKRKEKRSIRDKMWDKLFQESFIVFKKVVEVIKPDLIVICSTLAGAYVCCESNKEYIEENNVFYTTHSTFPAWKHTQKRFNDKTGEERFREIVENIQLTNSLTDSAK